MQRARLRYQFALKEGAVLAAQVAQRPPACFPRERGMTPRHGHIVRQGKVAVCIAANSRLPGEHGGGHAGTWTTLHRQDDPHWIRGFCHNETPIRALGKRIAPAM